MSLLFTVLNVTIKTLSDHVMGINMKTDQLRSEMQKEARKSAGASVGIPPRHMDFSHLARTPRYFYRDNATITTFLAMLSSIFPPGERFFVESVRHYRNQVTDPTLKAEVSGFIGQEAIHGREHERLNELLMERNIDTKVPEAMVTLALRLLAQLPPSTQLACTTFMEHFTALLGEALLTDTDFIDNFDPEMLHLWQWHALEEVEHKNVAYDVYELIGNSHLERHIASLLVVAMVGPAAIGGWFYLLAREGKLTDIKDVRIGLRSLLGKGGFVTRIISKIPLFTAKSFHPNKHDTSQLAEQWREILFGENGELNHALKNRSAIESA